MSIVYTKGDATQPPKGGVKVIVHCCNNVGAWGAGFVEALSKRWQRPEEWYRRWYRKHYSPLEVPLSGPLPPAYCWESDQPFSLGYVQFVEAEPRIWVANIIGQEGVGRSDTPPIRYPAILEGLSRVYEFCAKHDATVHAPRFGAGLAGGEWPRIEALLTTTLINNSVSVTIYDL